MFANPKGVQQFNRHTKHLSNRGRHRFQNHRITFSRSKRNHGEKWVPVNSGSQNTWQAVEHQLSNH